MWWLTTEFFKSICIKVFDFQIQIRPRQYLKYFPSTQIKKYFKSILNTTKWFKYIYSNTLQDCIYVYGSMVQTLWRARYNYAIIVYASGPINANDDDFRSRIHVGIAFGNFRNFPRLPIRSPSRTGAYKYYYYYCVTVVRGCVL
jgi:hypothetical protein